MGRWKAAFLFVRGFLKAERAIGSIRRDRGGFDHAVVLNEAHLLCMLRSYLSYYAGLRNACVAGAQSAESARNALDCPLSERLQSQPNGKPSM